MKISVLGSGNLASYFVTQLCKSPSVQLIQQYSRRPERVQPGNHEIIDDLNQLKFAHVYLLAVSDNAVAEVAQALPFGDRLLAHSSGSLPLKPCTSDNRFAVFYPLQTFTHGHQPVFKIPFCLEAERTIDLLIIKKLASYFSEELHTVDSNQRMSLHLSAVFVNNFVNHLHYLALERINPLDLPPQILEPLLYETIEKLKHLPAFDAQTGPARRNDKNTIHQHRNLIKKIEVLEIYDALTHSILKTYEKKL